ncbi:acyltransferase family protein [soil metagenome]
MPSRDPWLDNAKFILVTLVVVGHFWTLLPASVLQSQAYDFLYAWHMPAFVLVTGYLSRRFTWSGSKLWGSVRTLLVPYLIFEAALVLFRVYVGGEVLGDVFVDPTWPIWYLVALLLWRLVTPAFTALPAVVAVAAAVALCLVAGFWGSDATHFLDLARVLGFLPFFVLGLTLTEERLALLRRPTARVAGVVVLGATFFLVRFIDSWASTGWLYYRSYDALGVSGTHAMVVRASVLLVGLLCALGFLALVPRSTRWYSHMGAATLVVYLFHGFVIRSIEYAGFSDWAAPRPVTAGVVAVLGAVGLSLLLASRPVAAVLDHVVDPYGHAERQLDRAVELSLLAAPVDDDADDDAPLGTRDTSVARMSTPMA